MKSNIAPATPQQNGASSESKDGHPDPFKIQYVEIGNEDQFDRPGGNYDARFAQFYDAIKAKYPKLQLIATTPVQSRTPDVIDDHYYRSSRAMERDVHHYDKTDRNGPKIFVGEWATTEGRPHPQLRRSPGRCRLAHRPGTKLRHRRHELLRPAARQREHQRQPMGHESDRIQRDRQFRIGLLSRSKDVRPEPRRHRITRRYLRTKARPAPPPPPPRPAASAWQPGTPQAQFKDIKVTNGDQVLFQSDFSQNTSGWRPAAANGTSCRRRTHPNIRCHQLPNDRRRSRLDGLHLHSQGPQNRRKRRLSRHVPRPRPRRSHLVERRRLGQYPIRSCRKSPTARTQTSEPPLPSRSTPIAGTTSASNSQDRHQMLFWMTS